GSPPVVVASDRAPDDVFALNASRASPIDAQIPRVATRQNQTARDLVVAPDDVLAPNGLHRNTIAGVWVDKELGGPDRAKPIQKSRALFQRPVALVLLSRVLQDRFDQVR